MDKVAGKIRRAVRFSGIAILLGILVGWYRLALWPIQKLDRCFVVPAADGVAFVERGQHTLQLPLRSINGAPLYRTEFAVGDESLIYWSHHDSAIGIVAGTARKTRWYPVGGDLWKAEMLVRRITTNGRFISMDVQRESEQRSVLLLDLEDGRWRSLGGVVQARLDMSHGDKIALLMRNGEFLIANPTKTEVTHKVPGIARVWDWDYSFDTNTLYVLENSGDFITIRGNAGPVKQVKLPRTWNGLALFWQSKLGELWVLGHGVYSSPKSAAFSGRGEYLGALPVAGPPFYAQGMSRNEMRALVAAFSKARD